MNFTEKMKELVSKGATMEEIASSFGLDVNVLPPEWSLFFSNSIMLTYSLLTQLESVDTKIDALTSAVGSLQDSLREKNSRNSSNSSIPPSKDGYSKPNRDRSLREKSGKKARSTRRT